VCAEQWQDWDAGETLVTNVLVEHDGRTTLTSTSLFDRAKFAIRS
jgi:hypothetical protein